MKKILKYSFLALVTLAACSREKFAEMNTNPDAVLTIDPKTQFPTAALALHTNDFEAFYDYNRNINIWTLLWVQPGGNGVAFRQNIVSTGSYAYRIEDLYSRETGGVGGAMKNMQYLISLMPPDKKATYTYMNAITGVPLAYTAFYVSDLFGSIAYSDAFQARYTNPPNLTPKYDSQEQLYTILDNELKGIVNTLKTTSPDGQVLLGTSDLWYHGVGNEAQNWARAANSLRLRIAMRMLKRKPDAAKAIVNEVLSDNLGPINSRDVQWIFKGGGTTGGGGNWNPGSPSGRKDVVDFMNDTQDPRVRMIYQKSAVTQAMFDAAKAQGKIAASDKWRAYTGRYGSPDASKNPDKAPYVTNLSFNYNGRDTSLPMPSQIQNSIWDPTYQSKNATRNFPVITYADVCFMRAELAARGVTTEDAQDWYYKGIDASMADYNDWGKDAKVNGYQAMTADEITAYKNQPGVKFDAANAIEQICLQQFIHLHTNSNELWALMKRTGYPSVNGVIMKAESVSSNGVDQPLPRRWALNLPVGSDLNYTNKLQAITDMQKDPELGDLPDITGRVWWDKK
ncbi:MAG: SusD/RagB family nutrient-binding outer membrane lipoprotein [Niabella sp.]|nr:SusD/RagB family nutrient-binding outer membrane lipoprotein [Niabella sp.]